MISPRQQSFLFLEFLQVSESQPILLVFGLIKWAASVSVAHLSHKHAGRVESHQGNLSKVPPSRPSVLTKFQGLMLCSFSPRVPSPSVSFPSWFTVRHLPIPARYAARKGLAKCFKYRVTVGMSAVVSRMLKGTYKRPGPVAQLCPWWKCTPT